MLFLLVFAGQQLQDLPEVIEAEALQEDPYVTAKRTAGGTSGSALQAYMPAAVASSGL